MNAALDASAVTVELDGRRIIENLDIRVAQGAIVLLTGHNGAGKTTLLQSLLRLAPRTSGEVRLQGHDVSSRQTPELVAMGLAMTQQTQPVFPNLSVAENLRMPRLRERSFSLAALYDLFPVLSERGNQSAGTLSGGQRQMLSIALALRCGPQILMLDEPSVGLQPTLVEAVMATIAQIRDEFALSVLLVEQNLRHALAIADVVVVMSQGRIVHSAGRDATSEAEIWGLL